jgi:hypothetical protein
LLSDPVEIAIEAIDEARDDPAKNAKV